MNGRLVAFDMAGNSIVFDIAEEVLPTPRAGGNLFWACFSRFSGTKLKHTSIPPTIFLFFPPLPSPLVTP